MNTNKRNRGPRESFSIVEALFYPFTATRAWFADALIGDDSIRQSDGGALSSVVSVLTLPFRLLFAFAVFMVQAWSTSRKGRAFLLGVPAVGVVVVCGALLYVTTHYYNRLTLGRTAGNYRLHASRDEVKPKNVLIFAEKWHTLKPDDEEVRYRVALALDADGQDQKAIALMDKLAPQDTPGYIPAHLWLARRYINNQIKKQDKSNYDALATRHLELIVQKDPANLDAQSTLASQYQIRAFEAKSENDAAGVTANLEKAATALENVVNPMFNPDASKRQISIAQILQIPRLLNIKRELGSQAGEMARFDTLFDEVLKLTQNLPDEIRLKIFIALRDSAISVKDYNRAVQVMQQAFQTFDNTNLKQQFVRSSARIQLLEADQHQNFDDRGEFMAHLAALCKSLNANPADRDAYERLIDVVVKIKDNDQNLKWLKESLLDSPKLSLTHLLIGFTMIREGDIQDGKSHWKIAFRLERIAQTILNNIIDIASSDKRGLIENMFEINLIALEMFDQPMLYQSLAVNFLRTQEIEEAVKNFEIALDLQPALIRSHFHLVKCYETLGNVDKAALHQQKLDEYLEKLPTNQRDVIMKRLKSLL